ncbi:MAG: hypothetical protein K0R51_1806 [Cytophagaceae bacterium]|jgi:hypothetical protein|nr:hypothetical protein [Cytophagaceae bacterium]
MKKVLNYASMFLLGAVVTLSSCKKTDDDPTPDSLNADVSLTMNENGSSTGNENFNVKYGQKAVLEVTAITTTSTDMRRLYVYRSEDGSSTKNNVIDWSGFKPDANGVYYYEIPSDSKNNFVLKREVTVSTNKTRNTDKYHFYFTSNDNFNVASTNHLLLGPGTITLIYPDFKTGKTGQKLYNICSAEYPSAYNLEDQTGVTATVAGDGTIIVGPNADLTQQSGEANCGTFNGWVGQNGTAFVKANDFDWENASAHSAGMAYASGAPTYAVNNVQSGDIYIAKLKGTNTYSVFKITAVNNTGSNNDDNYVFDVLGE